MALVDPAAAAAVPPPSDLTLHRALRAGDPHIVFQPIVDLSTGEVTGYEALSRFMHVPGLRVDEVFDLATATGRGFELEVLAVRRALEAGSARPAGTTLSVNLSPSSLSDPTVFDQLPPDLTGVQVEMTEHEVIEQADTFLAALAELRSRGGRIAVDDVGEGYAGLQRVMRIRPDVLKVDRSLVTGVDRRPGQAALVEAIVHFAARTGAVVCAEGVETADELSVLADLDVRLGQGFFIGRPADGFATTSPEALDVCRRTMHEAVTRQDVSVTGQLVNALLQVSAAESLDGLARALAGVAPALGADAVELSYLDDARTYVEAVVDTASLFKGVRYHLDDLPLTRHVLEEDVAAQVVLGSPDADPDESTWMIEDGIGSLLMLPVRSRGRVVGLFEAHLREPTPWRRNQIRAARTVASVAGPVLENLLHNDGMDPRAARDGSAALAQTPG